MPPDDRTSLNLPVTTCEGKQIRRNGAAWETVRSTSGDFANGRREESRKTHRDKKIDLLRSTEPNESADQHRQAPTDVEVHQSSAGVWPQTACRRNREPNLINWRRGWAQKDGSTRNLGFEKTDPFTDRGMYLAGSSCRKRTIGEERLTRPRVVVRAAKNIWLSSSQLSRRPDIGFDHSSNFTAGCGWRHGQEEADCRPAMYRRVLAVGFTARRGSKMKDVLRFYC